MVWGVNRKKIFKKCFFLPLAKCHSEHMFVRPPTCTLNLSFQMFSVYFTPDLPEGRAKAGEAGQFASYINFGKNNVHFLNHNCVRTTSNV